MLLAVFGLLAAVVLAYPVDDKSDEQEQAGANQDERRDAQDESQEQAEHDQDERRDAQDESHEQEEQGEQHANQGHEEELHEGRRFVIWLSILIRCY